MHAPADIQKCNAVNKDLTPTDRKRSIGVRFISVLLNWNIMECFLVIRSPIYCYIYSLIIYGDMWIGITINLEEAPLFTFVVEMIVPVFIN